MQQAPSEHKETPLAEGWPSSGTGCPESLWSLPLGGNQKLLGHSPGHSALSVPAWAGFGPEGHKRSLPTSASLWFSQDRLLVAGTFLCNWIYSVVVLLKVDCQLSLEITKCRWAFHQPPELLPAVLVALADRGPLILQLAAERDACSDLGTGQCLRSVPCYSYWALI